MNAEEWDEFWSGDTEPASRVRMDIAQAVLLLATFGAAFLVALYLAYAVLDWLWT